MDYIFSESFIGQKLCAGQSTRLSIRVSCPTPHPIKGFQCDVALRFELGPRTQEDGTMSYTGKTALRALGRALLAVDSALDLRMHNAGPLTIESSGETFDPDLHSAMPKQKYERSIREQEEVRRVVDSVRATQEEMLKRFRPELPRGDTGATDVG